jgi:ribonuclease HI
LNTHISIYTDGSCHTQHGLGAWAAIILSEKGKTVLSDIANNTTHQRMELIAIIKCLEYIQQNPEVKPIIQMYSDSQYVIGLKSREKKIVSNMYLTAKGNKMANQDLVKEFFLFSQHFCITYSKLKSHQKLSEASKYNIEVDKLSRKLVRDAVKQLCQSQLN